MTQKAMVKRELGAYFSSPIAYIVGCLFLVLSGILFFSTFFLANRADLRNLFSILPVLFSFFIPAITMKSFAEERKIGSFETLITLPVTPTQIVIAKFIASFLCAAATLIPTLFYLITACMFGNIDMGPVIGGYLGALFLIASFTAIGLFTSSLTKYQLLAFFISFIICVILAFADAYLILLPSQVVSFLSFIFASSHFDSIARGIIDTRDLLYFISLTAIFLGLTVKVLKKDMRG